ncbi:PAS domain S-box protein [Halovivax sp.]|uniref:PAS domain S-box protein n=1 Tax=Halovivax sp. TaxID=1935978 RepID=UPI0025C21CFE|nr:PAS domain S-box protein [Halovivax sp.]
MGSASPRVDDPFAKEVLATLPDAVLSVDESGTIVFANPAVEGLLGYAPAELLERSIDRLVPDAQPSAMAQIRREAIETPRDRPGPVTTLVDDDGDDVPVRLSVSETSYDDRRFYSVTLRSVPSDENGERSVATTRSDDRRVPAERRLREVLECVPDGAVVFDPNSDEIVECNAQFCELLGYAAEDLVSLGPSGVLGYELDRVYEFANRVLEEGTGQLDDLTWECSDGEPVTTDCSATRLDLYEEPVVIAAVRDVTARSDYERQLAALDESSRRLMIAETDVEIADVVVDVVQTVFDRSLTAVWGYERDVGVLRPLAASEGASARSSGPGITAMGPITRETIEMEIFRSGEPRLIERYDDVEAPAHPEMSLAARLVVPLGPYGLLTVGSPTAGDIDPGHRELVEILARTTRTAFEHVDRERELRHRSAAMDAATDGIGITDSNGTFTYANDALAELFGYEDPDQLVGTSWKRRYASEAVDRLESEVVPIVVERGRWRGETIGKRTDGTTFPAGVSLSTLGRDGIVCVVRDVTDRKAQERQLERLNEVARDLMRADTREEIARTAACAVENVFDFEVACVRLFDRETARLEPVALTDGAEALLESHTAYDLEATLAGHAFRREETVSTVVPDVEFERSPAVEYPSVHVPIGSDGVVSVVLTDDEVDDRDVRLLEMLSVNVRTAIERAERVRLLEAHERELRQQHDQLETLHRINSLVQLIEKHLVEATTRPELEATICETLAESELYTSAWIGDAEVSTGRIVPRAGTGIADDDLEAIAEMPLKSVANGTAERAIETGAVQVLRQYRLAGTDGEGETDERVDGIEATAAVPITYGDRVYGVLVVHGAAEDVFGENAIGGFELLGEVTGFAISAIENRHILLSDSIVELEFEVADPRVFYLQVTAELDCTARFQRSVPLEGGKVMHYHTISGAEPAAVLDLAASFDHVEEATAVAERGDGFVLQTVASESPVEMALDAGAVFRSAVAEDGVGRLVVEAPQSANVREIVDRFEAAFSTVDLRSKRDRERSIHTAEEFRDAVADRLTEKQRAAIESAFFSGYYDWPREITAEELAESMGVSSSTLHQHLRKGIWHLLSAYLQDRTD